MSILTLETIPEEILTSIGVHLALLPDLASPTTSNQTTSSSSTKPQTVDHGDTLHSASPDANPRPHPSALIPLLRTSKYIHSQLSLKDNPRLYAEIFAGKFDTQAILRREAGVGSISRIRARAGSDQHDTTPMASEGTSVEHDPSVNTLDDGDGRVVANGPIKALHLSLELRRRCIALNNLHEAVRRQEPKVLKEQDVWTIYLMLLENGQSRRGWYRERGLEMES